MTGRPVRASPRTYIFIPAPKGRAGGLDDEQRAAAPAPRGPVRMLAGAGTGKTRTITHRIAYGVHTGARPRAGARGHLHRAGRGRDARPAARLGVGGVQARTFHAAALRQLRYFGPRVLGGEPCPAGRDQARLVARPPRRARGVGTDAAQLRDLASEIEWAKASLVTPDDYPARRARRRRESPVAAERSPRSTPATRRSRRAQGCIDFEDLLLVTAGGRSRSTAASPSRSAAATGTSSSTSTRTSTRSSSGCSTPGSAAATT